MPTRTALFAAAVLAEYAGFGPATLWFEEVHAQNRLVPHGDVRRRVQSGTLAIRSDGSRMVRWTYRSYHHWFIPDGGSGSWWMKLDAPGRRWTSSSGAGTVDDSMIPPVWAPELRTCGAKMPAGSPSKKAEETEIAGLRAEVWLVRGIHQAFVPRLGCGLGHDLWHRGGDWLPSELHEFSLLRVNFGEPDPALFEPPDRE